MMVLLILENSANTGEPMTEEAGTKAKPPKTWGEKICTVGACMFGASIILGMFLGIGGAAFHNFMQIGGLILGVGGAVMWKVFKK
jgi:uncharacterized membrane protein